MDEFLRPFHVHSGRSEGRQPLERYLAGLLTEHPNKSWLRVKAVALRCWRVTADGQRRLGWLIGEGASDGKRRYCWSDFGRDLPLVRLGGYAHRRHWVEQFHEEAKELLGWDPYRGRSWTGFHRHAVLVLLACSFLVWQEFRHRPQVRRRGRPRRPFSPAGRPSAPAAAGGASARGRLTAIGSPGPDSRAKAAHLLPSSVGPHKSPAAATICSLCPVVARSRVWQRRLGSWTTMWVRHVEAASGVASGPKGARSASMLPHPVPIWKPVTLDP
ncbi:MAG TPA: hypothetical protein VFA26_14105 [Gemmataceae bacterium]|nr:hypothetical protein [Gemmataceae bacterium]